MSPDNNTGLMPRSIIVGILLAICAVCSIIFANSSSFRPVQSPLSYRPPITNPEIVQNWLPAGSYTYTVARIDDYLTQNQMQATSLTFVDDVLPSSTTYDFAIILGPSDKKLALSVELTNNKPAISTLVTINGQQQLPSVPSSSAQAIFGTTHLQGFDTLVNTYGLTAVQTNELVQQLEQFAPAAKNIVINTSTVRVGDIDPQNGNLPYTFTVTIDGTSYHATLTAIGLSESRIVLDTISGKQAFDSGTVSQGS